MRRSTFGPEACLADPVREEEQIYLGPLDLVYPHHHRPQNGIARARNPPLRMSCKEAASAMDHGSPGV